MSYDIFRELDRELNQSLDSTDFDGQEIEDESLDTSDPLKRVLDAIAPKREKRWLSDPVDARLILDGTFQPIDLNSYRPTTTQKPLKQMLIDPDHKCYSQPLREHPEWLIECMHEYMDKGIVSDIRPELPENLLRDIDLQLKAIHGHSNQIQNTFDIEENYTMPPKPKKSLWARLKNYIHTKIYGEESSDEVFGKQIF